MRACTDNDTYRWTDGFSTYTLTNGQPALGRDRERVAAVAAAECRIGQTLIFGTDITLDGIILVICNFECC